MNYLAHAFLSFHQPELLTGNMISDFVKGKKKLMFSPGIQKGIELHRAIDTFTDQHPVTASAKSGFKPVYGLYAGAFIDIVYDHFLAKDPDRFPTENNLQAFAEETYTFLQPFEPVFPEKFRRMFPYMRSQNWLFHYRFPEGIRNSFHGLVRRAAYMHDAAPAFEIFTNRYEELKMAYENFFPDLFAFTKEKSWSLLK